eukprot:TRINITY_DN11325_c0_g1_i2.p2 TRINITY_DN11325_c0_g1~~TRINITY_DN11325_c0_g1_i2.p2  ORF type:complete len:104 (-),score=19.64 TRINITY_DN11325_c0_g1_i2:260-544(-)
MGDPMGEGMGAPDPMGEGMGEGMGDPMGEGMGEPNPMGEGITPEPVSMNGAVTLPTFPFVSNVRVSATGAFSNRKLIISPSLFAYSVIWYIERP